MNRSLFSAVLAALLIANTASAKDNTDQTKHELWTDYQFTEAALKQLDRVHVTAGTRISVRFANSDWGNRSNQQASLLKDIGSTLTTQHFDWIDQDGKVWSVSVDDLLQPGDLRINKPMIQSGPVAEDDAQRLDESLAINSIAIPEPASVSLFAIGAAMICPQRRKTHKGHV